ncbi:MAG: hypothetical protein ACFFD6_01725 [Candidatus Thorarchaeota archaeon]
MQAAIETFEVAQLFIAIGTLVAAGTIIRYSRSRSAGADMETKRAFRPLYLFALAMVIYAIGTFVTFYEAATNSSLFVDFLVDYFGARLLFQGLVFPFYTLFIVLLIETIILGIASSMIIRQRFLAVIVFLIALASFYLLLSSIELQLRTRVSIQAYDWFNWGSLIRSALLLVVTIIFIYIASTTRRGTTAAMSFALMMQLLNLPDFYGEGFAGIALPVYGTYIIVFLALMGPAMLAFTFLRPDQRMTGELLGYGASFAGPALVVSGIYSQGLLVDPVFTIIVIVGSFAITLSAGTAAYLFGRWRESRQVPTFLLLTAFALFAFAQLVGMLGNTGSLPEMESIYFEILSIGLALTLLSITSIFAAGYRSAGLFPLVLYIPVAILIFQEFPTPIEETFVNLIWFVIPLLIVFLLPVILFSNVWRRMKAQGAPGRLRPLGIALGILLFLVIRIPILLIGILGLDPGYALVTISFFVSWMALTGRLDRTIGMRGL